MLQFCWSLATEWMLKNPKGPPFSFLALRDVFIKKSIFIEGSPIHQYLALWSPFAIFAHLIWRRLGLVPACFIILFFCRAITFVNLRINGCYTIELTSVMGTYDTLILFSNKRSNCSKKRKLVQLTVQSCLSVVHTPKNQSQSYMRGTNIRVAVKKIFNVRFCWRNQFSISVANDVMLHPKQHTINSLSDVTATFSNATPGFPRVMASTVQMPQLDRKWATRWYLVIQYT